MVSSGVCIQLQKRKEIQFQPGTGKCGMILSNEFIHYHEQIFTVNLVDFSKITYVSIGIKDNSVLLS